MTGSKSEKKYRKYVKNKIMIEAAVCRKVCNEVECYLIKAAYSSRRFCFYVKDKEIPQCAYISHGELILEKCRMDMNTISFEGYIFLEKAKTASNEISTIIEKNKMFKYKDKTKA